MKILTKLQDKLSFLLISKERKSKIHTIPRKQRSIKLALEFLYYKNITSLPIDFNNMDELFEEYNWVIYSYNEAKKVLSVDDPLNIRKRKALARTLILRGTNTFLTVYRENFKYPRQDYYTIAHELGHIVLGHFFDYNFTALERGGLTKKEYAVLEREAEIFAAEFIMPMPVLKKLHSNSYKTVMSVCQVTKKAAEIRTKEILDYVVPSRIPQIYKCIEINFYMFMYKKQCDNCGNHIVSHKAIYCPICSNKLKWGDGKMLYNDGHELNENGKAIICPRCGNEEIFDGSHCKICGTYIINRCSNINGYETQNGWVDPCGRIADGNARYCIYCGEKTTFYKSKLLVDWGIAREAIEEAAATYEEFEPQSLYDKIVSYWATYVQHVKDINSPYADLINEFEPFDCDETQGVVEVYLISKNPLMSDINCSYEAFSKIKDNISDFFSSNFGMSMTFKYSAQFKEEELPF